MTPRQYSSDEVSSRIVRETLSKIAEDARRTFAIGRVSPSGVDVQEVPQVARCGWCGDYLDEEPEEGPYVESTTICDPCIEAHLPEALP